MPSVQQADYKRQTVTHPKSDATAPHLNGNHTRPESFAHPPMPTLLIHERDLPTFPIETGFWEHFDAETNTLHRYPLTLLDLLFPDQDELGVLVTPESPLHDLWSGQLAFTIRANLKSRNWLLLHDVFIYWPQRFLPPAAPDLAIIPDAPVLAENIKSYQVGRDGPPPIFVAELISESSRTHDMETKRTFYASVGVKEYLVVDQLSLTDDPWRVYGYRLGDEPYYTPIPNNADGGVTFTGVGLRFVPVGRTRIDIYDLTTGERLLTPDELKERADSAEARVAELEAMLRSKGLLPPT